MGNYHGDAATPADAAKQYYLAPINPGDVPKPEQLKFVVAFQTSSEALVDVMDYAGGDSTYQTYTRLTLEKTNAVWRVVRCQAAWQGRGRLGWTTRPTL